MRSRLPIKLGCLLACILAIVTGSCSSPGPAPGTPPVHAGSTLFKDDNLAVAVRPPGGLPTTAETKKYEPHIKEVSILLDGQPADLEVTISSFGGKGGWGQAACFTVPPETRSVTAILKIEFIGQMFRMTVPFQRSNEYGVKWHADYFKIKTEPLD